MQLASGWGGSWARGGEDGVRLLPFCLRVARLLLHTFTFFWWGDKVNEWGMKGNMLLRPVCSQDAAPHPSTFCFSIFCSWGQSEKMLTGGWGNFCNVSATILQIHDMHAANTWFVFVTIELWNRSEYHWGVKTRKYLPQSDTSLNVLVKPVWVKSLQKANALLSSPSPKKVTQLKTKESLSLWLFSHVSDLANYLSCRGTHSKPFLEEHVQSLWEIPAEYAKQIY